MPRDIEHIVETHRAARERVAAGLPVWDRRINLADIWRNDALSFEAKRDAIVRRIRRSGWITEDNWSLDNLVEELGDAADTDEFDAVWDVLYDHADADRVWIATF